MAMIPALKAFFGLKSVLAVGCVLAGAVAGWTVAVHTQPDPVVLPAGPIGPLMQVSIEAPVPPEFVGPQPEKKKWTP